MFRARARARGDARHLSLASETHQQARGYAGIEDQVGATDNRTRD